MPFPHPYSRKDHCRNEDKPCRGSIVWNLVERTINVTEDGNAEDEVNPAKNGTCEASAHDVGWLGHGVTPRILTFGLCFFPVSPVKVLAERYFRGIASWRKERAGMGARRSRLLRRLRRPTGGLNAEQPGVLGVQSLKAG